MFLKSLGTPLVFSLRSYPHPTLWPIHSLKQPDLLIPVSTSETSGDAVPIQKKDSGSEEVRYAFAKTKRAAARNTHAVTVKKKKSHFYTQDILSPKPCTAFLGNFWT